MENAHIPLALGKQCRDVRRPQTGCSSQWREMVRHNENGTLELALAHRQWVLHVVTSMQITVHAERCPW
jgi:hypothetical protein